VTNAPADGTAYMNGETISYRITVTNDGTAELHSLNIADSLTGDEWNNGQSLASGEKLTFDTAYKVTVKDAENGFVTNQAVGSAQDANGNFVEPAAGFGEGSGAEGKAEPVSGKDIRQGQGSGPGRDHSLHHPCGE
jgi:uncharacterized repeat protein (TIGR01451 family)